MPLYAEKEKALILSLDPNMLMSCDNIASVYDLRPLLYKNYDAKRFRFMYRLSLTAIKVFSRRITTDSDYQRADISKYLKYPIDRIDTIYCGWEHLKDVVADEGIFKKHPELKKGEYYYSLGSLAPHKNFKWVMEIAKKNPDKIFAIAGGKDLRNWKDDIETTEFNNITFVGYVSDEESKALMQNCKAFLHPSIYEGFGIPPLEALSCGAKIIISNATCLPEVYEDSAHYFDPYDYEVDLDKLLDEEVADPNKILEKCSWDKATKQISALIEKEIYEVR